MGIRFKILSGFLILSIMLLVAGIWSIHELTTIGTSVQQLLDDNYRSIDAAKTMIEALEREDSGTLLLLSGKWEEGRSIVKSADTLFQQGYKIAENNVTIPGEKERVLAIAEAYTAYRGLWIRPIVGTKHEGSLNWYFGEVHTAFLNVKIAVQDLMTLNDQTMYHTASDLENRAHRATMPGVIAIVSALIFTIIFNYLINYYVVSPIIKITNGIQQFVENGTPLNVKIETEDELSKLLSSINGLLSQLKHYETTK